MIGREEVDAERSRRKGSAFPGGSQVTTVAGARGLAFALLLGAYSLYFSRDGMSAPFAVDTFTNIYFYWRHGAAWLLGAQLQLWGGNYRPLGGLFYLSLFHFFGLNPAPYHLVMALIVLANAYLVYAFARILGCGESVSGLAALIACYHVGLRDIYYNTSFIYDVLCFFFYFAAFVYYARIRSRGQLLRGWQIALFLGLYICALNSKEMAVTLPIVLGIYECIYHGRPEFSWRGAVGWLRSSGRAAILAGALTLLYIYGKALGPDAMTSWSGYHPVFSWKRFMDFQYAELSDILHGWTFSLGGVLAIWLLLVYLSWRKPRPVLRFCCIFIALAPLPIEFLEGRRGACLYVPLAAWAVFGSVIFMDVTHLAAVFMARQRCFLRVRVATLEAVVFAIGVCYWASTNRARQVADVLPAMAKVGGDATDVIRQLNHVNPRVHPNSQVIFLNGPLPGSDLKFVADLWFHDRGLTIRLAKTSPPIAPEDLPLIQYCFDFRNGNLIQGCRPPSARPLVPVRAGIYDDSDQAIQFRGIWEKFTGSDFEGAAFHTLTASELPGARISFAFEGTALTYVFTKAFNRGLAELRIDGVQKEIVDLYSPKIEWQSCITVCCLPNGKHMGTVRVLGRNSSHSSGRFVDLDAFVVQ
jgi:hypothetical protein